LLESSIVATLLKFLILVGDKFKIPSEHHFYWFRNENWVLSGYWNTKKYQEYFISTKNLNVAIANVIVWLQIELQFDHQLRRNFPMTNFWSVGYKYTYISSKIDLLAIWTTYLTLESSIPSHTSFLIHYRRARF
jgi:hypothetical protein